MSKKIMIIDDEMDMQIYLQTLFKKAGYETVAVSNGAEALEKIADVQPDLITLDILMPKKSGLNFFQALRELANMAEVPVIVVSGVTKHSEFFEKDNLGGPTLFVEKPIEPDSLLGQVRELLGD